MALVSIEGKWLQANKALCNFLGYSQTELQSLTFQQLTWPEDLNTDLEQLEQLVNGDINTYTLEKRYYTRDGEVVWALLAVSVVRHADGSPLYFIAQIEDINDLKQTEWVNKRLMERITLANEAGASASGSGIWSQTLSAGTSGCLSCMKSRRTSSPPGSSGTTRCCRKIAPTLSRCCGTR
jgi:PAS domain S-box-containing protein